MNVILSNNQCPGDILAMTAAIRDLKKAKPDWKIAVRTHAGYLWRYNPDITSNVDSTFTEYYLNYQTPRMMGDSYDGHHFCHEFHRTIERIFGIKIPRGPVTPALYLGESDYDLHIEHDNKPILLINAGAKADIPLKQWSFQRFQEVVDALTDTYTIIQIGRSCENHKKLHGVLDYIDKTPDRQIVKLMVKADAVLTGVSFPMHLCQGVSFFDKKPRKCVVLAGGREDPSWEKYQDHTFLSTMGMLDCCKDRGCWMKHPLARDNGSNFICKSPTRDINGYYIGSCMEKINVDQVVNALRD